MRGALLIVAGVVLGAYALTLAACYDPNKPAPCDPHCTDPRVMTSRDAGADRR